MSVIINDFEEYEGKYKRIISVIELDEEPVKGCGYCKNKTTFEQPLRFNNEIGLNGNILYINKDYYYANKEDIDKIIIDTLEDTTKNVIELNHPDLIDDKFLGAISRNKNISTIKLDKMKKLIKSQIDILLSGNIDKITCSVDFNDTFDFLYEYIPKLKILNYPKICGRNDISDFANNNGELKLYITEELTNEKLIQLQKLFDKYPQEKVIINFAKKEQIKDIVNIIKSNQIIILDRKKLVEKTFDEEDYDLFANLSNDILMKVGIRDEDVVKPIYLKKQEQILKQIVDEVNKNELSPLEKYMYMYNVVKLFKEYKKETEEEKNKSISRNSTFTLFNEYMVCVGYTNLLCEINDRLKDPNISICDYRCVVLNETENKEENHRRCLVKIKDDKYGVDGVYISDPTWDSVEYFGKYSTDSGNTQIDYNKPIAHWDFYNHFLMTKEEVVDEKVKYACPDETDVLFESASNFSKEDIEKLPDLIWSVLGMLQDLDFSKDKKPYEMIEDLKQISQPIISVGTIISAINEIYSKVFHGSKEDIENLVQQTIDVNNNRHNLYFNNTKNKFNVKDIKTY